MKKVNCPSCAAEVVFQSSLSVYAVCKYCNSMIVRRDVDVESIGTMAALPDDMSPLQIGTGGFYNGLRFTIIGRMKIGWDDGVWNEWFLYTDDGRRGWLAEAQGSYSVSFELDDPNLTEDQAGMLNDKLESHLQKKIYDSKGSPIIGAYFEIKSKLLKIVDIKRATCIGSEGELPFTAPKGRKTLSVDLTGSNGEFACIEILDGKQRIYIGHYVEWDELRCDNLRPLEGW
jgi:hypothetical protein